jgi:hypothetical protein
MAQKSQKAAAKPAPAVEVDEIEVPKAKVVERPQTDPSVQRAKLAVFGFVVLGGWAFILAANKFHVTAPVVFVCLGYLALLLTVVNLWRTGAAAAGPASDDEGWGRPMGARGELEKEKRTLLKGIKEAEFDAAMGKLSKADADSLVRDYRARAIDVIKELDSLSADSAMSIRDQIALEVRARIALDASDKPSNRAKKAELAQQLRADARRAMAAEPKSSTAKPAVAAAPPIRAAQPKSMPAKLMVLVVLLFVGSVLNFVGGSTTGIVMAVLQAALAIGVLAGNDGVRIFLRGLAAIQILWVLVMLAMAVAEASDHHLAGSVLGSPIFWLIALIGLGTPGFLLWALGQHDVRDWMFQRSFRLATPGTAAPGGDDEDDDEEDDGGRVAAMKAKVAAAEERAAIAEAKVAQAGKPKADVTDATTPETDAAPGFAIPAKPVFAADAKTKASAEADAIAARVQADKVAAAEAKAAAAQAAAEAAEAKAAAAHAAAEAAEAKAAAAEASDDSKGERA